MSELKIESARSGINVPFLLHSKMNKKKIGEVEIKEKMRFKMYHMEVRGLESSCAETYVIFRRHLTGNDSNSDQFDGSISTPPNNTEENAKEEMRGFKTFLIATKTLSLLSFIVIILLVLHFHPKVVLQTYFFAVLELILFIISLFHAFRPSFLLLCIFVSVEVLTAVIATVMALVMINYDQAACKRMGCDPNDYSELDRFRLFWFLLFKATFGLFLCLIAVAHAPQVHGVYLENETSSLADY